jgi:hypothetical protein
MTAYLLKFPPLWQKAAYQVIIHISLQQLEANSVALKNGNLMQYIHLFFLHHTKASFQAFDSFLPKAHFRCKINEFRSKQKREKVSQLVLKKK